jgi:hypothetical protein
MKIVQLNGELCQDDRRSDISIRQHARGKSNWSLKLITNPERHWNSPSSPNPAIQGKGDRRVKLSTNTQLFAYTGPKRGFLGKGGLTVIITHLE